MKKTMFLLVLGLIVFIGCKNTEKEILNEITVSDKSVSFEKIAGKKEITVTSEESWAVTVNDSWIKTTQEKNKLVLEVSENMIDSERKGTIFIMARGVEPIAVEVKQAAGEIPFSFSPASISFKANGGSETVEIKTTVTGKYMVTASEEWLKAESVDGKVVITALANDTEKSRSAIVKIKVGEILKDINVDQEAPLLYILPMLPLGESKDLVAVNSFEVARGSLLEKYNQDDKNKMKFYVYRPMSKKVPLIYYVFKSGALYGETLSTALTYADSKKGLAGYDDFLKSNGFNYIYTDKYHHDRVYSKEENNKFVNLQFLNHESIGVATSLFEAAEGLVKEPKQPAACPTFSDVPYGVYKKEAPLAEVDAWENANGAAKYTDQKHPMMPVLIREYKLKEDAEDKNVSSRIYVFFADEEKGYILIQQIYVYNPLELGLYLDDNKRYYPTEEFLKLIEGDGFKYSRLRGDGEKVQYVFSNAVKEIEFTVSIFTDQLAIATSQLIKQGNTASSNKYMNMSFDKRVEVLLNESSSNETFLYKGIEIKLK